jgi:hypothetical protein
MWLDNDELITAIISYFKILSFGQNFDHVSAQAKCSRKWRLSYQADLIGVLGSGIFEILRLFPIGLHNEVINA